MSKEITIKFEAIISDVEQDIEILTDDTPEKFVDKLNKGDYFTTLCYPRVAVLNSAGETVGIITDTEISGSYDYFELGT
jgi:hypothetical protein